MTPQEIEALFTGADGTYFFARWGRGIAPVVFGVKEETLEVVKGAFQAVCALAGHPMEDLDPELGSNCMVFFLREWDELLGVPDLEGLVPGLADLVARLGAEGASQYRSFRFDGDGAIMAAVVFLRMRGDLARMPAEDLALEQVVRLMLAWSGAAFRERSPLGAVGGRTVLRPEIAALLRAAYDPVLPVSSREAAHGLRLFARIGATEE